MEWDGSIVSIQFRLKIHETNNYYKAKRNGRPSQVLEFVLVVTISFVQQTVHASLEKRPPPSNRCSICICIPFSPNNNAIITKCAMVLSEIFEKCDSKKCVNDTALFNLFIFLNTIAFSRAVERFIQLYNY